MTTTRRKGRAPKSTKTVKETDASKAKTVESLKSTKKKRESAASIASSKRLKQAAAVCECSLAGEPVLAEEARRRWPERYAIKEEKHRKDDKDGDLYARCHYEQALVNGVTYNLFDDAYIIGEDEKTNYIGRIIELFESIDKKPYFTAQWFLKAENTNGENGFEVSSTISSEGSCGEVLGEVTIGKEESDIAFMPQRLEMKLLDLYSGCGGMSTGLCLGAAISGVNLVTRWAVDNNEHACQSLEFNHPETKVRNESADDFLELLKKWYQLCEEFCSKSNNLIQVIEEDADEVDESSEDQSTFEVEKLIDICFGDLNKNKKSDLYFKVRWKGYD